MSKGYQTSGDGPDFELGMGSDKKQAGVAVVLLLLVVMSAIAVIYSSYKSRQLFSDVQQAHKRSIQMKEEWGRLLLEQSTWASPARIEQIAIKKLKMKAPESSDIKVIKQ